MNNAGRGISIFVKWSDLIEEQRYHPLVDYALARGSKQISLTVWPETQTYDISVFSLPLAQPQTFVPHGNYNHFGPQGFPAGGIGAQGLNPNGNYPGGLIGIGNGANGAQVVGPQGVYGAHGTQGRGFNKMPAGIEIKVNSTVKDCCKILTAMFFNDPETYASFFEMVVGARYSREIVAAYSNKTLASWLEDEVNLAYNVVADCLCVDLEMIIVHFSQGVFQLNIIRKEGLVAFSCMNYVGASMDNTFSVFDWQYKNKFTFCKKQSNFVKYVTKNKVAVVANALSFLPPYVLLEIVDLLAPDVPGVERFQKVAVIENVLQKKKAGK